MNKLPEGHPFRRHSENLAGVQRGLIQCERAHKAAIRRGDVQAVDFHARINTLIVGIMAEALLRKAVWDPSGFNDRERSLILDSRSQLERWRKAVEYAFRRHYSVPLHLDVDPSTLDGLRAKQYADLDALLHNELEPIIGDRNDIAHGQWGWLLNASETAFTGPAQTPMNYLQIHRRSKAVSALGSLIHTLAVSEPTFQHDYDIQYARIAELREGFDGADYAAWGLTLPHQPVHPSGQQL